MKRKQLLALGVAGMLSMGSITSSAIAAENVGPVEETTDVEMTTPDDNNNNTENDNGSSDSAETPAVTPEETPSVTPDVTPDAAPVENQDPAGNAGQSGPEQTPEKSDDKTDSSDKAAEQIASETLNAPEEEDGVVTSFEKLKEEIDKIIASEEKKGTLILAGEFEFSQKIVIPEGCEIVLIPNEGEETITFKRAATFVDSFFEAAGRFIIAGTETSKFIIDGTLSGSIAESPLVKILESGEVSFTYTTLQNNQTSTASDKNNAGAIINAGTLILDNSKVENNTSESNDKAIYSSGVINVAGTVTLSDVFLDKNPGFALYNDKPLSKTSVISFICDSNSEGINQVIAITMPDESSAQSQQDTSDIASVFTYKNEYYSVGANEAKDKLVLQASNKVKYIAGNATRKSPSDAEFTLTIASETGLPSTNTILHYFVDGTGTAKPDYTDFDSASTTSLTNKAGDNKISVSEIKTNEKAQQIWYYIEEKDSTSSNTVFKSAIQKLTVPQYMLNLKYTSAARVNDNGYNAQLSVDANAIGGTIYFKWLSPEDAEIDTKNTAEFLKKLKDPKYGQQKKIEDTKVMVSQVDDKIINVKGTLNLYCYIEKKDGSNIYTSSIRGTAIKWPYITECKNPANKVNGNYADLKLQAVNADNATVYANYIDAKGKAHLIKLGSADSNGKFNMTIPEHTVKLADGKTFEVKSYSIYVKKGDQKSQIYEMKINPTPTPSASPSPTPTLTPSPKDPGVGGTQVVGISSPYLVGAKVVFGVQGAGMDNYKPNKGDIRYYPYRWKAAKTPQTIQQVLSWSTASGTPQGNFTQSSNGYFYGSTSKTSANTPEGSYPLTIVFKKQVFDGNAWVDTGEYAKIDKYFELTKDPNKGVHTNVLDDDDPENDNIYEENGIYYRVLSNGTVVAVTPALSANSVSDNVIYKVLKDGTRLIRKMKIYKQPDGSEKAPELIYIGDDGKAYLLKENGEATKVDLPEGAEYEAVDGTIYKVLEDGSIISTGKTSSGESTPTNDHIKTGEAAPTGDDTPITYMVSMLALSMLAGGYVLVRRRKKN